MMYDQPLVLFYGVFRRRIGTLLLLTEMLLQPNRPVRRPRLALENTWSLQSTPTPSPVMC